MKNFFLRVLALSSLVLFFILFSFWPAVTTVDLPLKIGLEIAPAKIDLSSSTQAPTLRIKYRLINTSGKALDESQFFGRITLSRGYAESAGFILRQFNQTLDPGQKIAEEFVAVLDFLPAIPIKYQVYFNWYQKGPRGLDKIVASATRRLDVAVSEPGK